jgi:excisionase family DNA binding protein
MDQSNDFLSVDQAAAYLGVSRGQVQRLLRQHGLGEFLRASMGRQVLISRADLEKLRPSLGEKPASRRSGAA